MHFKSHLQVENIILVCIRNILKNGFCIKFSLYVHLKTEICLKIIIDSSEKKNLTEQSYVNFRLK